MSHFTNVRLLIADYYDDLIRQIDIYAENQEGSYRRLGEKCFPLRTTRSNFSNNICGESFFTDPYSWDYKYDHIERVELDLGQTRADYINQTRQRQIDEIRKLQDYHLEEYEINKDAYIIGRDNMNESTIEDLKGQLFKDKFCFVLEIPSNKIKFELEKYYNDCLYNLFTVITDFYLSSDDLKLLKGYIDASLPNAVDYEELFKTNIKTDVDEKYVLVYLTYEYIMGLVRMQEYGFEVVQINKASLLTIEKFSLKCSLFKTINLGAQSSLDFSSTKLLYLKNYEDIKSGYFEIVDLRAFCNLEYLLISGFRLKKSSLDGLNHLIKLEFEKCKFSQFDLQSINNLSTLEFLIIDLKNVSLHQLDFAALTKLRSISLINFEYINYININPNLTAFESNCQVQGKVELSSFSNLISLSLNGRNNLESIERFSFQVWPNLKNLYLNHMSIKDLGFLNSKWLSQLEKLNLSNNSIETVEESQFSNLKSLKYLSLSINKIKTIKSHAFRGLENIEKLELSSLCDSSEEFVIENNVLSCLANLIELNLSFNKLTRLDPDMFIHTPKLEKLILVSTRIVLEDDTFSRLANLKTIYLDYIRANINKEILGKLQDANVEIFECSGGHCYKFSKY